ncbi:hypothetical protein [uncultured Erythrobacter sp.]|uniref:hypothetical protein n=1 Tax=uncultured Erythrobacter sp. TaxID=263913 RepID=UPI0026378E5E|nr:hypothetical protein [uncultured Erythrobacter sp.]
MRTIKLAVCLAVCVSLVTGPAAAQSDPADAIGTPEVVGKLFKCREIADPDERLACFDREVAVVYAAQESRELVIADREQVAEAKRGLFGLKLPNIKLFGGGDDDDDKVNELTATLTSARRLDNGRFIFELEDGARWIQTEDSPGRKRFKAGDTIVIKRAALGSFKARVNDKSAGRVRRLN